MLDLFSGIGGFSLAAKWAGINTVQFVEKDTFCQKVLAKNFPNVPIHGDVKTFNCKENIDLVTAGIPCQPFSIAGKKKGKDDSRYLWPETLRIIKESKFRWLLFENVPGIVPYLDTILEDLEKENYTCWPYIIAASSIGAPHKRERLWVIANRNSERSYERLDNWQKRSIQENEKWHLEKIQQEWSQFFPDTWSSLTARDWLQYNCEFSGRNDGLSTKLDKDRIKALGNSIVPQMVYPILRIIAEIEKEI